MSDVQILPEKVLADSANRFANIEEGCDEIFILDDFCVRLGVQFSEVEAYRNPGEFPVFTAATNGAQYWVADKVPEKQIESGPALIWNRKGAAGNLQIIKDNTRFYTTNDSGVIKPRLGKESEWDLVFLQYYLAAKLKERVASAENNGQLNNIYVMSTKIKRIPLEAQMKWLQDNHHLQAQSFSRFNKAPAIVENAELNVEIA